MKEVTLHNGKIQITPYGESSAPKRTSHGSEETSNPVSSRNGQQKPIYHKEFKRPLLEILEDLRTPIPKRFVKQKVIKGNRIEYVRWTDLAKLLDFYAPGYEWRVSTNFDGTQVCVHGELTIHAAEGSFTRSAVGDEHSDVDSYGSSFTNAEAQAFRRACGRFGLGISMWN